MLRRKLIIQNLSELLNMQTGMSVAAVLTSILRSKQYSVEDSYYADDTEVSSVIEKHIAEFKQKDDKVSEEEINEFYQKNISK